jgi:hypothetical protein
MTVQRECEQCGHEFQTRKQRINHERRGERGERVLCPCGDVCVEASPAEGDDVRMADLRRAASQAIWTDDFDPDHAAEDGHSDDCEMIVKLLTSDRCTCGYDVAPPAEGDDE